jgi:hypothetical protein
MLQVTWLLLILILYSESRVLVKRSFNDQSVRGYLTEVLTPSFRTVAFRTGLTSKGENTVELGYNIMKGTE